MDDDVFFLHSPSCLQTFCHPFRLALFLHVVMFNGGSYIERYLPSIMDIAFFFFLSLYM